MRVYFYQEMNGSEPARDFLDGLPLKVQARIVNCLNHIVDQEGHLAGVMFKKLHGYPMEEIRIKESHNLHRIIIHVQIGDAIIVLHGFTKKEGQETPKKELNIAYQRFLNFKQSIKH